VNGFNQGPELVKQHPLCGCTVIVLATGVEHSEALMVVACLQSNKGGGGAWT
jgi:hypothetical protein